MLISVILRWFLGEAAVENAVKGHLTEEELECRLEQITNAVLDPLVDVYLVRNYFTIDAWKLVENIVAVKKNFAVWVCKICHRDTSTGESIVCEACLEWHHFNCVGLTTAPKRNSWCCRLCHQNIQAE